MWRLALLLAAHTRALRAPARLGRAAALRAAENDNPDFLEQNLGDASTAGESKAFKPFLHPLAGVSVSPRGFVAVLASPQTDGAAQRALPVVIHRADVDRIRSPYALAFLQLIQGIDVATAAILPPDALQKHVGKDDAVLQRVRVVAATQKKPTTEKRSDAFEEALPPIAEKLEKTLASSLNVALPAGAAEDLLRKYAAEDGSLNREAFASVVADAREAAGPVQRDDDVAFQLVLEDGDRIPASPFLALALALRHRCELAAGDVFDGPHAVDATDLDLPIQRLEALVADGARLSAHFATMFDAATRDAALPNSKEP